MRKYQIYIIISFLMIVLSEFSMSGLQPYRSAWFYSCSVNWIEWLTGYNFFPKLPSGLQELVEEMTAAEHLCSFNEFDPLEHESPDPEIDYEWEMDLREIL